MYIHIAAMSTPLFSPSLQAERKLEATQETIIDQQQTIEKFRDLVRHLQDDITELRERGEKSAGGGADSMAQSQTMMNLNVQLKSTMKAHARVREPGHSIHKTLDKFVYLHQSSSQRLLSLLNTNFCNWRGLFAWLQV